MKKTLYIATLLLLSSCTKSTLTTDQIDNKSQVIMLSTHANDISKGVVETTTSFKEGDKIGVFQTFQPVGSNIAATIADLSSKNFGYSYATPYWSPSNDDYKLLHTKTKMTKLFAYFPFDALAAEKPVVQLTVSKDAATLDFTLPVDQTSSDNKLLNKSDLMYAKATGVDEAGYVNDGNPIALVFNHKLTKFGFKVKVENSTANSGSASETVYLRRVEVKGDNIIVGLDINLLTGVATPKTPITTLFWEAKAADKGVKLSTLLDGVVGLPSDVMDLLLVPFVQLDKANKVVFYISDNNNALPPDMTINEMLAQDILVDYVWEIPAPTATQFLFNEGVYNKISATIDIALTSVDITATIEPWGVNDDSNDIVVE